jgi:MATE family multidrug resistance protein
VVILLCRDYISYIYTGGEDVAAAVSKLTPLLALTLILNGIQPVLSGNQSLHTQRKQLKQPHAS